MPPRPSTSGSSSSRGKARPKAASTSHASLPPSQSSLDGFLLTPSTASSHSSAPASQLKPDPALITYSNTILESDSIFIATAFPLNGIPSKSHLQSLLNTYLSPPRHDSLPAVVQKGKGIPPTHRMFAWRVLAPLKGSGSFEVVEASEDDGEQYAGDRMLRALRELGAVDCFVVCSRWFGGSMIGPIRFEHITRCTTSAAAAHLLLADVAPLRASLLSLDSKIASLRSANASASSSSSKGKERESAENKDTGNGKYEGLTVEKGERLVQARSRTLAALKAKAREGVTSTGAASGRNSGSESVKRAVEEALEREEEGEEDEQGEEGQRRNAKEKDKDRMPDFGKKRRLAAMSDRSDAAAAAAEGTLEVRQARTADEVEGDDNGGEDDLDEEQEYQRNGAGSREAGRNEQGKRRKVVMSSDEEDEA